MKKGFVALVGAGPGDVSLLTVRGKELLDMADVVLFDKLVSKDVLDLMPTDAKKINVGKVSNNHTVPQDEINKILLEEAQAGNFVVRLKGGDPFVFGRGGEELELLAENNVKFEVVPGVTAGISAPSFAGIPVTHRDFCSSVHFITGHKKKNQQLDMDFESLVKLNGTLVFYMGISNLKPILDGLLAGGMDENIPAALVENGTRACQRKVISTVSCLYQRATEENFASPSIIIVGKVCSLSNDYDWFSNRELFGQDIIITSPRNSSGKLQAGLMKYGANLHIFPAVEIVKTADNTVMDTITSDIPQFSHIVFTSKNGVDMVFEHLYKNGKDSRYLSGVKVAAIGPSTKSQLLKYGVVADIVPDKYNSESFATTLLKHVSEEDKIMFVRAEKGNPELVLKIQESGASCTEYKIYDTNEIVCYKQELEAICDKKLIVCFTSGSVVDSFVQNHVNYKDLLAVCIGKQTASRAKAHNLTYVVSENATIESMIDKILEVASNDKT